MSACCLCARRCGVDRLAGETGECRLGTTARIASAFPHHGEEPILSGWRGSGTIFLSGCPLHCVFCQNHEISHGDEGRDVGAEPLAMAMDMLVESGCHNLNFVTPSHLTPQILESLGLLVERCRQALPPIVWNCGGYESPESLALLYGLVDIYMPDFKFLDPRPAGRFLKAPDYGTVACAAVEEMFRQVGPVRFGPNGMLERGVLVRHLVMPGFRDDTRHILEWLASMFQDRIAVNVMGQYHPAGRAMQFPELAHPLDRSEWAEAVRYARHLGLRNAERP